MKGLDQCILNIILEFSYDKNLFFYAHGREPVKTEDSEHRPKTALNQRALVQSLVQSSDPDRSGSESGSEL